MGEQHHQFSGKCKLTQQNIIIHWKVLMIKPNAVEDVEQVKYIKYIPGKIMKL